MRLVTVCQDLGPHKVPGADHTKKAYKFAMSPGTAWRIDDETREHEVVQVRDVSKATYQWCLRWIDGRTVAVFQGPDGKEYAQPIKENGRARAAKEKPRRGLASPRREAPGVAPQAPAAESQASESPPRAPAPKRRRKAQSYEPL